jgi:hypothetical protein
VIATATVILVAVQVGVIVYMGQLARRIDRMSALIERDIEPVIANFNAISASAARAASLAVAQMERADRLFADFVQRADETVSIIQNLLVTPVREGRAVLAAITGAVAAFRQLRGDNTVRGAALDEEDPLFIG